MLEPTVIKAVTSQIHHKFPEFAGCQPKVHQQDVPQPKALFASTTYLLTYASTAQAQSASGSKAIPRWVRVVVNEKGKILKITTSR
jgi:hypothetical protein